MNQALYPYLILGAAVFHITEEFIFPGGFLDWGRKALIKFKKFKLAEAVDSGMAIFVNTLFVLFCIMNIVYYRQSPFMFYSLTGLILFNAFLHIGSIILFRRYAPGLITSVLLYIPVSLLILLNTEIINNRIIFALITGALLHVIPFLIVFTKSRFINSKSKLA